MQDVRIQGIPFRMRPDTVDMDVLKEVIEGDCYQLNHINLRKEPNVVDVGGHIGAFTKLAAWKWPHGKFYVYEANSLNHNIIEYNLSDIADKTTLYKGACVGKIPANHRLVIAGGQGNRVTGGWGIIYGDTVCEPSANSDVRTIDKFYSLSELFIGLDKVDILKLDCEGSEFSIIKELSNDEMHKIDYLVCELHCGALPHAPMTYQDFRAKILKHFVCPELEGRPTYNPSDLFNFVACNRKLLG